MKQVITLSANTTGNGTYVGTVTKKRDYHKWEATIFAYGTWGTGTLTWYWSPDGGTTVIAFTDLTDAALSMTTNKSYEVGLCTGSHNSDKIQIYVQLTGATSPSLTVGYYDNN